MVRSFGRRRGSGIRPVSGCPAAMASAKGAPAAGACSVAFGCAASCIALGCGAGGHGALVCGVAFCCGGGGHAFGAVMSAARATGISVDFDAIDVGGASTIFAMLAGMLSPLADCSFDEPGRSRASVAVALASTVIEDEAEGRACSAAGEFASPFGDVAPELPVSISASWRTEEICGPATCARTKVVTTAIATDHPRPWSSRCFLVARLHLSRAGEK